MDDLSQFDHLQEYLSPVESDAPCGEDLDASSDEEYMRIEREVDKADESREWKKLKKDIAKVLLTTKDFRLAARFCRTLLQTEASPIEGLAQGLYITQEYIEIHWDCVYPPEDVDDPDEKYADRINAIAELGSWSSIVLFLRKKCPILSFDGMGDYYLEDLVAFKNGDAVADKQSPKEIFNSLSDKEKEQIDKALNAFTVALKIAENIKQLLADKTGLAFIDFDGYLLPNLQDGVAVFSDLSPNAEAVSHDDEAVVESESGGGSSQSSSSIGSIQNRDDVVRLLDMICGYYEVNEPSSPLPLLLKRARSIVHKDFLEVLEELVPDSVSMTEPVFGRSENNEENL